MKFKPEWNPFLQSSPIVDGSQPVVYNLFVKGWRIHWEILHCQTVKNQTWITCWITEASIVYYDSFSRSLFLLIQKFIVLFCSLRKAITSPNFMEQWRPFTTTEMAAFRRQVNYWVRCGTTKIIKDIVKRWVCHRCKTKVWDDGSLLLKLYRLLALTRHVYEFE